MSNMQLLFSCILLSVVIISNASFGWKWRRRCRSNKPPNEPASYMILAPKTIRAGLPYAVSVNLLGERRDPVDVQIKLADYNGNTKLETTLEALTPGRPTTANLGVIPANLTSSTNKLLIKGIDTRSRTTLFEDKRSVTLNTDSLAIFVQTDKAMYKPSDLVQFRVVVSKPDLTPFKGFANVQIRNAQRTVIKEFKALSLTQGVASGQLQLSEEPPLGLWSMIISVEDERRGLLPDKKTNTFEVRKYVLPKFEVKLTVPEYSTSGKDIPITVAAKYTYDKPLRGTGVVAIQKTVGDRRKIEERITLNNAGKANVLFKYSDLSGQRLVQYDRKSILLVQATVRDDITGIERNTTAKISMFVDNEKFVFVQQGDFFKPGLDYPILISVVTMDDNPIPPEADRTVHYKTEFRINGGDPVIREETIQLDEDGTKQIVLKTPENSKRLNIWAHYKEKYDRRLHQQHLVSGRLNVDAFKSPTGSFIQLTSDNDGIVKIGDNIPFTVTKSTGTDVSTISLQVISKGSVVFSKELSPHGDKYFTHVPITHNMAPKSQVIAYAIRPENSEVLVDAATLQVDGLFRNNVTIAIDPKECKPYNDDGVKNEVTVTVKADPGSYVGLLGVDQSVLLLKSGNDITQSEVESEMEKYTKVERTHRPRRIISRFWRRIIFDVGGKDASTLMKNSGLHVLTDAYLYEQCIPRPRLRPISIGGGGGGGLFRKLRKGIKLSTRKSIRKVLKKIERKPQRKVKKPKSKSKPINIRSIFPHTWIFTDMTTGADGSVQHRAKVPDTITSFVLSAFATNERSGLGIAASPAKLKIFRPFFITLNLPYSIKQGEKFGLQVLVFNYGESDQTATITLERDNDSGFDFVKKSSDTGSNTKKYNQRKILVKGGGGTATVKFPIVPTIIGHVKFLVKAIGQSATDAVERKLLVEPEGVRVFFNNPMVLDFTQTDSGSFESTIDMTPPAEVETTLVQGSERAEFSVLGDLMGPLLSGLGNLVRMPTGCGEQNMVKLVPNVVVMKYLDATGKARSHPKLVTQARKFIEIGYQRQLNYKHRDGSFSAFGGGSDKEGSTWLTAYVIRSFSDAKDYTAVDPKVIGQAISFVNRKQRNNGEFEENGRMLNTGMQGGAGGAGVPLTAFVLISLLQAGKQNAKAVKYLEDNLERHRSQPYTIAITAYALGLARSDKFNRALDILTESAINKDGKRYWKIEAIRPRNRKEWWQRRSKPAEIETTSYAILAYLINNRLRDALPCMRWLSSKRNSLGGFASTQDTVVGIGALAEYAKKVSKGMDINIDVTQQGRTTNFRLNDGNKIVLHRAKLGDLKQPVKVTANGKGLALAQVAWHYNVRKLSDAKPFECTKQVSEGASGKNVTVALCCKYAAGDRSNMAVIEVESPSGFKVDKDVLDDLAGKINKLKRTETSKDDTLVSLYFDDLDNNFSCFDITSVQLFDVAEQKPSQIRLYDYYEPDRMIQLDYSIPRVKSLEQQCVDCFDNME